MGRLLGDLRHTIDSKVKDSDSAKLKLAIYSCHDTSLAGILFVQSLFFLSISFLYSESCKLGEEEELTDVTCRWIERG
jgi:hypothetical protein